MNLKVFSLILAVVLAFTAFSSFGVFATELEVEEEPTVEELAYTARMAMHFSWYIYDGIYTQWRMYYEFGSTLDEFDQWLISKGMFVEPLESKVAAELLPLTDFHTGQIIVPPSYLDKQPYYAFPSSITMKEIKEAYFSLFYYDICNILNAQSSIDIQANGHVIQNSSERTATAKCICLTGKLVCCRKI